MRSMRSHAFWAIYFWDFICLKSIYFPGLFSIIYVNIYKSSGKLLSFMSIFTNLRGGDSNFRAA